MLLLSPAIARYGKVAGLQSGPWKWWVLSLI